MSDVIDYTPRMPVRLHRSTERFKRAHNQPSYAATAVHALLLR